MTSDSRGSPTISAIIPVRDGAAFIEDAIDSVLSQTVPPSEVIVVDDGSRDGTADVVARFGPSVRLVRQEAQNQSVALNRGIEEAAGALLSFCDADDMWTKDKLERQLEVLDRDREPLLVSGLVQQFVDPSARDATRSLRVKSAPQRGPLTGTLLARREVFGRVGLFNSDLYTAAGVEWIARARALEMRVETVEVVVLLRRVHGQNITVVQHEQWDRDLLAVMRAHRRRNGGSARGD
ncbi:MAG: glycosyltransferase family 2 protein [Actinobacteria bacterium]|nr:glycosyltransferase family 2 protein [Actinomycetota bacterium]